MSINKVFDDSISKQHKISKVFTLLKYRKLPVIIKFLELT